jgi:hypothetical protein
MGKARKIKQPRRKNIGNKLKTIKRTADNYEVLNNIKNKTK